MTISSLVNIDLKKDQIFCFYYILCYFNIPATINIYSQILYLYMHDDAQVN